jgi:hypothetical protein
VGNIVADPLFLNPAERDYRLATNSPCVGTGRGGANMGVIFPVGGVPSAPLNLQVSFVSQTEKLLSWQDNSGNESGFIIERSTNSVQWSASGNAPADASNALVAGLSAGQNYFFRIRATNFIGESFNSNVASSGGTAGDRDGDGMPNDWETAHMFNPDDPSDASGDPDHDGASNLEEYLAGTDPRDMASRLRLEFVSFTNPGQVELQFVAISNKTYTVEYRDSLSAGNWQGLIDVPADASTRVFTIHDSVPPGTPSRFYRVVSPQR